MSPERTHGLAMMTEVYGFEMSDGPGDYFAETADHLFGRIWSRPGLTHRDRRLLLLGALTAQGNTDVADIQVGAALGNGELTAEELEEIVLFLCYYAGWPNGTKLGNVVGPHVARARKAARRAEG
ncbi:carboxymuconolactone decarboxylase [Dietzia sp. HMSC21D01]|uniref:Carboxymuconolactone decarboxylase family protein n=2 Tax=Dietziaceae TaxID=85029 RepID=A0AAW5QB91_9ACTN|nr:MULTISPECIES: carboxymuconolactone decarboxylase family protein [Dietzia]PWD94654.1 carboxymuconolactone decarboxylase family protein [Dietzia maris]MCT1864783.1 carboxymuconolactone decarboxylase family protein [Dietzia cinnamea]MCT2031566.1 carboxymuconolactone decarboxylase family protein [Dietzia cinnamea]MCT2034244.1 carboxymuconolactone decarboxylase family protein [Dietzia cinnamea]MCT2062256.1 carboxymuconolactone decarboxylase family protein [Dietzia cinnamea]